MPQTLDSCPLLSGQHNICNKNLSRRSMSGHVYIVNVTMVTKKMPPSVSVSYTNEGAVVESTCLPGV